jgi:hypothetical protein
MRMFGDREPAFALNHQGVAMPRRNRNPALRIESDQIGALEHAFFKLSMRKSHKIPSFPTFTHCKGKGWGAQTENVMK